jgi:hypothetical protein
MEFDRATIASSCACKCRIFFSNESNLVFGVSRLPLFLCFFVFLCSSIPLFLCSSVTFFSVDADHHCQFKAAGHQPQGEGGAVKEQTVLAHAITRTDLLQVVEDGLRPIRNSLASMEGRIGRVKRGPSLPVQHTTPAQIPAPHSFLATSL